MSDMTIVWQPRGSGESLRYRSGIAPEEALAIIDGASWATLYPSDADWRRSRYFRWAMP